MSDVTNHAERKPATRISRKHQITIPVKALRAAGLKPGERLTARAEGPGRIVLERETDLLAEYAGALTGVDEPDALDRLRDEGTSGGRVDVGLPPTGCPLARGTK